MAIISLRTVQNYPGVIYDPFQLTKWYAEDQNTIKGALQSALYSINPLSLFVNSIEVISSSGLVDGVDLSIFYSTYNGLYPSWNSVYSTNLSNSSKWESVYSSVLSNSTSWLNGDVLSNSTKWESVYAEVLADSSKWQSVFSNDLANSVKWESVYSSNVSTSATWNGKQDALGFTPVPNTRTVNGLALSSNITLVSSDISLGNVTNDAQLKRSSGDFAVFSEKTSPSSTDIILIEDSASSNVKKKVQIGNLNASIFPNYYYSSSDGESNTTSTYPNYINKLTYTVTPAAGTYILEWQVCYVSSGATLDNWIKVSNTTTTTIYTEGRIEAEISYSNTGWMVRQGFIIYTSTGVSNTFTIDFCRHSTGTSYTKNARILLRRVA